MLPECVQKDDKPMDITLTHHVASDLNIQYQVTDDGRANDTGFNIHLQLSM